MKTAFVLYISDDVVGPCLHLIRRICNPRSESMPHITVRYPIDKLQANDLTIYQNLRIGEINVVGPGAFGLQRHDSGGKCTVFIRCNSDSLEAVSYKPDFPDSIFHITLYDGKNLEFARQLLQILQKFRWGFRVPLPVNTKLSIIEIGNRKKKIIVGGGKYQHQLNKLFNNVTSKHLSTKFLNDLTDIKRLEFAEKICAHLQFLASEYINIPLRSSIVDTHSLDNTPSSSNIDSDYYSSKSNRRLSEDFERFTNNQSIHLTPPELAHDIVAYAVSNLNMETDGIDFGDPTVGTGIFFGALHNIVSSEKIKSAIGIEIDPRRVAETRNRWAHRGLVVETGDYLHMEKLQPRNLIVANPPYLRFQKIPKEYRIKLQERASILLGMEISGQASLYVYFLLLSHKWMNNGAIAAWLIPSEFMGTNYGKAIRRYLTEKVKLILIHKFEPDNIQFENVLVTSAVVVFRNCLPTTGQKIMLSNGGSLKSPEYTQEIMLSELINENKWTIPWIKRLASSNNPPKIGDLFTICRGIATGANDFFVMERGVAIERGIPDIALRPILPKARFLNTDIIESDVDGYPQVSPQLCLLDCDLSKNEIETKYPTLQKYLDIAFEKEVFKSALVRRRKPWYRQEQRAPSPFLCTYMGRGSNTRTPIYFIWNKSKAIATNTYLMLYPKQELGRLIAKQPETLRKIFILLKDINSQDLLANGRVYGGGLHKIEPKELLKVRFPSLPSWLEQVVYDHTSLV